jgi:hypothetical protein
VVQKVSDAAEKCIRWYGCVSFHPARHKDGRNTQEDSESLGTTFQKGNSRYDPSLNHPIHDPTPSDRS